MPEINGKQVIFREKLRADQWWPCFQKLATAIRLANATADNEARGLALFEHLDWDTAVQIVGVTVKSWEFDGEPSDPKAVADLDPIQELMPIIGHVIPMVTGRANSLGEAGRRSTSASDSDDPSAGSTGASG